MALGHLSPHLQGGQNRHEMQHEVRPARQIVEPKGRTGLMDKRRAGSSDRSLRLSPQDFSSQASSAA
jgi:hypothetical protein